MNFQLFNVLRANGRILSVQGVKESQGLHHIPCSLAERGKIKIRCLQSLRVLFLLGVVHLSLLFLRLHSDGHAGWWNGRHVPGGDFLPLTNAGHNTEGSYRHRCGRFCPLPYLLLHHDKEKQEAKDARVNIRNRTCVSCEAFKLLWDIKPFDIDLHFFCNFSVIYNVILLLIQGKLLWFLYGWKAELLCQVWFELQSQV